MEVERNRRSRKRSRKRSSRSSRSRGRGRGSRSSSRSRKSSRKISSSSSRSRSRRRGRGRRSDAWAHVLHGVRIGVSQGVALQFAREKDDVTGAPRGHVVSLSQEGRAVLSRAGAAQSPPSPVGLWRWNLPGPDLF